MRLPWVVSKETFSYISWRVWHYLWRWGKRRHPNKNSTWVRKAYFKTINGNKWTFACNVSDRHEKEIVLILYPIAYTPIKRHVKVKGNSSPDDSSLNKYWEERNQKLGKSHWAKGSKYYLVAHNQKWKCPICGQPLLNEEEIETHHIVPVAQGGLDDVSNLQHLHTPCHKQVHTKSKSTSLK